MPPYRATSGFLLSPRSIFHDALGSTRALLDGTGAVVGAYGYSTYGAVTGHSGTAATPLQFDGDYTDPETGMIYLHARYYDPATGQFLSVDPALAATGTPYGYSSDNPVNLTDNSGQCPWCLVTSLVGAAVGGFAAGACGACGFEVAAGVNAAVGGVVDFGESYLEQAHNNAVQEGADDWASFEASTWIRHTWKAGRRSCFRHRHHGRERPRQGARRRRRLAGRQHLRLRSRRGVELLRLLREHGRRPVLAAAVPLLPGRLFIAVLVGIMTAAMTGP